MQSGIINREENKVVERSSLMNKGERVWVIGQSPWEHHYSFRSRTVTFATPKINSKKESWRREHREVEIQSRVVWEGKLCARLCRRPLRCLRQ